MRRLTKKRKLNILLMTNLVDFVEGIECCINRVQFEVESFGRDACPRYHKAIEDNYDRYEYVFQRIVWSKTYLCISRTYFENGRVLKVPCYIKVFHTIGKPTLNFNMCRATFGLFFLSTTSNNKCWMFKRYFKIGACECTR